MEPTSRNLLKLTAKGRWEEAADIIRHAMDESPEALSVLLDTNEVLPMLVESLLLGYEDQLNTPSRMRRRTFLSTVIGGTLGGIVGEHSGESTRGGVLTSLPSDTAVGMMAGRALAATLNDHDAGKRILNQPDLSFVWQQVKERLTETQAAEVENLLEAMLARAQATTSRQQR